MRRTSLDFVHFFEQNLGKCGRAGRRALAVCVATACLLGLAACGSGGSSVASGAPGGDNATPSSFLQIVTGQDDAWLREQVAPMDREEKLEKIAHLFDYGYSSKTGLEYSGMAVDGTIYLELQGEGKRAPDYTETTLKHDAQATWDEISDITGLTDFDLHVTMRNRDGDVVTCKVGAGS